MSFSRRQNHRKQDIHNKLIIDNRKLNEDVRDLKDVLDLHHHLQATDKQTTEGLLRNEIDGSRWQYGGKGKLTTFKTGTDLDDPLGITSEKHETKMNRPISSTRKTPKDKTIEDLEKLKTEIDKQRALLEQKYQLSENIQRNIRKDKKLRQKENKSKIDLCVSNHPDSAKTPNMFKSINGDSFGENQEDILFKTDYLEIHEQKDKVLQRINTKVVHRNGKILENSKHKKSPPKIPEIGFGSRIDKKPEKVKRVKSSKLRNFRKAEPANVINDLEKHVSLNVNVPSQSEEEQLEKNQDVVLNKSIDKDILRSRQYLSEPPEEVLGLTRTLSRIKTDLDENKKILFVAKQPQPLSPMAMQNVFDEQKLNELLTSDSFHLNLDFVRNSTEKHNEDAKSKHNFENQNGHSNNSNNITPSADKSDRQSDSSASDYSSETELIVDNSVLSAKSAPVVESQKAQGPRSASSQPLSSDKPHVSNKFEVGEDNSAVITSPMTSNKKSARADRFVKTWIRNLGIEEVHKTALIFAKNNIGMAVMKYLTEEQVCEMGFPSVLITNKILEGIDKLKLSSSSKSLIQNTTESEEKKQEASKYNPNLFKRESRREKCKTENTSNVSSTNPVANARITDVHARSSSRNRQRESESKKTLVRPRSSSRSREMMQKKAEAAVAAAAQKKIDKQREEQRREKEKEKLVEKQKQHRDMLAAKHQEREIQRTVTLPCTEDPESIFTDVYEAESTGRSTALDNYLVSSRVVTPESSHRTQCASDATINADSDISAERVRSMIQTLLSSDHLQDNMTLNLVKNLQKQLEDVENRIQQKQEQITVNGTSCRSSVDVMGTAVSKENPDQTPLPLTPVDDVFRCDSNIGIWDPTQAPNLLFEILPAATSVTKTMTPVSNSTATMTSDVNRSKMSSMRGGVASMSMSKRALLNEIRKEKDEHRKQIRHLQSELTRLQHKDPVHKSEVPKEDIIFNEADLLGEGAFSKVYRGYYQAAEVAVKKLKVPLNAQDTNYFAAEVSLLRDLRHPRVVMFLGVCTETKLPIMILEYMSNGNLYAILHDPNRPALDHVEFYQISRDIASGMVYLHNHRPCILHLDLKSMNVLIGPANRAKIADFGFSKLKHEADLKAAKCKQIQGSPSWMAPELLLNGDVTVKSDVYSFGVVLWEMLTRKHPYQGCSMFQILEKVRLNKRPAIPDHCPVELQDLIEKCWSHNPAKRLVFKEILNIMENLSFPSEWRVLFAEAGIPSVALNDVQSTRNIISLVNSTLESTSLQKMVTDYQESIQEDSTGPSVVTEDQEIVSKNISLKSSLAVSDDISIDSLDEEFKIVTSEDSFEKIVVETHIKNWDSKELIVPENVKDARNNTHSAMSNLNTKPNNASNSAPKPSPRKLTKSQEHVNVKVKNQKGNIDDVRKSKEAWSLTEELQLPVFSDVPTAPPPPPVGMPDALHPPSLLLTSTFSTKGLCPQPMMKDLKKEIAKRSDTKLRSPSKLKRRPQNRFEVNVSVLTEQRKSLKPVSQPHAVQLKNLHGVPKQTLSSIAEILKKAMNERRFVIGEIGASNDAADWSYKSELSP